MFNNAIQPTINGGKFTIVEGNVYYIFSNPEQSSVPEVRPIQEITHVFKKAPPLREPDVSTAIISGNQVISVTSKDLRVAVWDLTQSPVGTPVFRRLTDEKNSWTSVVALSPNGRRVALGHRGMYRVHQLGFTELANENNVTIWDSGTNEVSHLDSPGEFEVAAFSPDGNKLVAGVFNTLWVRDMVTGECINGVGHGQAICAVVFSSDGRKIVSAGYDSKIIIWDAESADVDLGPHIKFAEKYRAQVTALAFSPDTTCLAVGFKDGTIILLDAETGNITSRPTDFEGHSKEGEVGWITGIVFSSDGKWFVSGSRDMTVRAWNVETGSAICKPLQGHTGAVISVAFSENERQIVSCSQDDTIRIWTLQ